MKQYRITSEHFRPQGDQGYNDTVLDPSDLRELKRLAGIPITEEGVWTGNNPVTNTDPGMSMSPVGSNISHTAQERNELMKEYHVMPGTDLWFIINFTLPKLTGSLRDHVEAYLKAHPEYRPRHYPED